MAANGLASRNILAKYPRSTRRVKSVGGSGSLGLSLSIFEENGEGGPPKAPARGQGRVGFAPSPLGEGWVGPPNYRASSGSAPRAISGGAGCLPQLFWGPSRSITRSVA